MSPATFAAIPSALPAAPGSTEEHWTCACGAEFYGHVHQSVRATFRRFFGETHSKPGCQVKEE